MEWIELTVREGETGLRLDRYLAMNSDDLSRSTIQQLIRKGMVTVDGEPAKRPSQPIHFHQLVRCPVPKRPVLSPKTIDLDILYEDDAIVVVNKQPGLVVHPGAGSSSTSLVEGLLVDRRLPVADDPTRPGIVHRLDKDTSGAIVVAKTDRAMRALKAQFAARLIKKLYIAQVEGKVEEDEGLIDATIGRDPVHPYRMTIRPQGRGAQTEFRVLDRDEKSTFLIVRLRTGRTHQIRVHMRYIGHPVVGDRLYGHNGEMRLMLHAWSLGFAHPESGHAVSFTAPLPSEFANPRVRALCHRSPSDVWPDRAR